MEKKTSWDDIPSLDGLGVDWEYKPTTSLGKRSHVRMNSEDIAELFAVEKIFVKIATAQQTYTGRLLDISEGGLLLSLPVLLEENIPVNVGFFLGTVKILSRAAIKRSQKKEDSYTTGVKFVDLKKEYAEYIGGLYASKILHHSP